MDNPFFKRPILNSPYEYPNLHWEVDDTGQPTQKFVETRRRAEFITPIPKPKSGWIAVKVNNHLGDEMDEGVSGMSIDAVR